ncbi:sugar phosphate isomerase/epimerase family protein [Cohnella zeiphila]|uniref:Sugar phosphate isomerase/epimerase n=1 Tax=Cohnella zeiphila TaxID=2761120 RepID=A0A7X0SRF4_9BACL|nr:sugar phosphate isomerase/epimerase [Cohnella zeiphila]MBB6733545.1 sugar phosphate isomerase/epimerase [Cohnella zeiphila]
MTRIACSTSVRSGSGLEEALAALSAAGFRYVDVLAIDGWAHVHPSALTGKASLREQIARTSELLERYELQPIAANSGVSPQLHDRSSGAIARRRAETEGLVHWMKELGIGFCAIQPRQPDPSRPWQEVMSDCVASLKEQVEIARAEGVTMALEFHVNSPFETMEQCLAFLERMPNMPIVYDPTHFVMQGVPLGETFSLMDRSVHVHLRDAAKGRMQTRFGTGEVDFGLVLGELRSRGYRGAFSIEYLDTAHYDVIEDAAKLFALIANEFPD